VLVAWGEEDRTVPCDVRGLRALVPQAQAATWPGHGHLLPVELAEEVGARLLAFWRTMK
jgi:pimeloyl-ACP methyl ester carboxylesterase